MSRVGRTLNATLFAEVAPSVGCVVSVSAVCQAMSRMYWGHGAHQVRLTLLAIT